MGREVRRVPADWQHPTDERGRLIPLMEGYTSQMAAFQATADAEGLAEAFEQHGSISRADYMPEWTAEQATHLMMYEDTSEGTPISPAFATPEELARWLVDNNASAFGGETASYEAWLRVALGGFAPSAIYTPETGLVSGVEGLKS